MRKKVGIIKRNIALFLIIAMSIKSFGAIVSDNDGSAFITKAEFDALKSSFQSQIDSYNNSIDSKIDGAIASYLAGIKIAKKSTLQTIFDYMDVNTSDTWKRVRIIGKNNESWFTPGWTSGSYGQKKLMPMIETFLNMNYIWRSPYWRGDGTHETKQHLDAAYIGSIRFQANGTSYYNISLWGQNGAVDEVAYGLRGQMHYVYNATYKLKSSAGANWHALTPTNTRAHFYFSNFNIKSNATDESSMNLLGSCGDSITTMNAGNMSHLRWGKVTAATITPIELTEPIINQDGDLWKDAGTSTVNGWTIYPNTQNYVTRTALFNYGWYTMNGTPSTNYKNSMAYFFPNADDDNQYFFYDSTDITGNYKKINVPEDDEITFNGTGNEVGRDDDTSRFRCVQFNSFWTPSHESAVLCASLGSPSDANATAHTKPVSLYGPINVFNDDKLTKVNDCYYSRLSAVSGTHQTLGDAPIFFGGLAQNGTATIKGIAFNCNNANSEWRLRNGGTIKIGFSTNGRSDEVLNTGTNTWEIKNCIPFKYRKVGTTAWTEATGPINWTGSADLYEFQFQVEKNKDYYVHALDTSNATNGRDEQTIHFLADTSVYEAEFDSEE